MEITFFKNPDAPIVSTPKQSPPPPQTMIIQLETITPEVAQSILSGNTDNRPAKERHVKFLADQMRAGAWQITGDPVKISASGRLLDGQHRLLAIVASETTQSLYVARNCVEEIFSVLDTGKNRSAGDVLATAGKKSYNNLAAMAKILIMHEWDKLGSLNNVGKRQTTNSTILDFVNSHDLEDSVTKGQNWANKCKLLSCAEWCAVHYLLAQRDAEQATQFLSQVKTGLNLTEGHPVFLLRTKLQLARDGRFNFSPAERIALTIKAWNALREGRKLAQLTWKNYEEFPEIN